MLPTSRIDHPNAWTTAAVRSELDIAYPLGDQELAELDGALNVIKAKGLAVEEITKNDFPLGSLRKVIAEWIHEIDYGKASCCCEGSRWSATPKTIAR